MAAVSSKSATGMGSGSASPSDEGSWNYAVTGSEQDATGAEQNSWAATNGPTSSQQTSTYPLNGAIRPAQRRSPPIEPTKTSRSSQNADSSRLAPNKTKTVARKISDISGTNSSDGDSLLDLYNQSTENLRTQPWTTPGVKRKGSAAMTAAERELESKWIHRDKLAQIESQEMREYGVRLGLRSASRGTSQAPSAAGEVVKEHEDEMASEPMPDPAIRNSQVRADKRQRTMSPSRDIDDENDAIAEGYQDQDPYAMQNKRPGTSRIPVSRTTPSGPNSPDPESPGQRSRKNSATAYSHSRNASGTNQILADPAEAQAVTSPTQGRRVGLPIPLNTTTQEATEDMSSSPPKGKNSIKKPGAAARNPAAQKNATGQKNTSNPSSPTSPTRQTSSRDGFPRPPTARPEGEPPWIATMFKPDPMLPPDQQMLPTHAKRLAQEQGYEVKEPSPEQAEYRLVESEPYPGEQAETKPTSTADDPPQQSIPKDLRPEYPAYPQPIQPQPYSQPVIQPQTFVPPKDDNIVEQQVDYRQSDKYQWPLKTPSPPGPSSPTQGEEKIPVQSMGGTPTMAHSPRVPSERFLPPTPKGTTIEEKLNSPLPRLPEDDEDEKDQKKKSCGCCLVM